MSDLAKRLHDFDMANTKRGSHHADGLGRMQDLVAGPIAEALALRSALQPDDLDTLADAVAYFNGMDSAAGRNMAGAIGRAMGLGEGDRRRLRDALQRIADFTDHEMGDGDGARAVAIAALRGEGVSDG